MSAGACLSIPRVVVEEVPATARLMTVTVQAETTTTVTAMATFTLGEVPLRPWRWRGTTPAHTPIVTLEEAPFPAPTPTSTHLSSHLTLVKSAYPQATGGRCTACPQT